MSGLRIGEVARSAGVSVETVRYYEQRGLLERARRSHSGYRLYAPAAVERLRFIRRAKALGFSLEEIRELLDLELSRDADRGEVKRLVEEKVALVDARIAELERLRGVLSSLAASCDGHGSVDACPILRFLHEGAEDGCH